ncbi:MAG: MBL fold metallo-hydrolase [Myxococcota bacterium]|nr:MBL fold metallo-hydrolase [Myxococcota bacterium]
MRFPPVPGHPIQAEELCIQVLGVAQDAGHPQAGCSDSCCAAAWADPSLGHAIASLAVLDPQSTRAWMIDATPDFPRQLRVMEDALTGFRGRDLDGIILTHGHIGHYAGLVHLGREAMGSNRIAVHAMPRLRRFLQESGPWELLVRLQNIDLLPLEGPEPIQLTEQVTIEAFGVPHRGEYTETVGIVVQGPGRSVLYLPDVDQWDRWQSPIEDRIAAVDVAYLDGTFFTDEELGGRSIEEVPHPRVVDSIQRFSSLPSEERDKIRFIHFNHSNPLLRSGSAAEQLVLDAGMHLAREGERVSLTG